MDFWVVPRPSFSDICSQISLTPPTRSELAGLLQTLPSRVNSVLVLEAFPLDLILSFEPTGEPSESPNASTLTAVLTDSLVSEGQPQKFPKETRHCGRH